MVLKNLYNQVEKTTIFKSKNQNSSKSWGAWQAKTAEPDTF